MDLPLRPLGCSFLDYELSLFPRIWQRLRFGDHAVSHSSDLLCTIRRCEAGKTLPEAIAYIPLEMDIDCWEVGDTLTVLTVRRRVNCRTPFQRQHDRYWTLNGKVVSAYFPWNFPLEMIYNVGMLGSGACHCLDVQCHFQTLGSQPIRATPQYQQHQDDHHHQKKRWQ